MRFVIQAVPGKAERWPRTGSYSAIATTPPGRESRGQGSVRRALADLLAVGGALDGAVADGAHGDHGADDQQGAQHLEHHAEHRERQPDDDDRTDDLEQHEGQPPRNGLVASPVERSTLIGGSQSVNQSRQPRTSGFSPQGRGHSHSPSLRSASAMSAGGPANDMRTKWWPSAGSKSMPGTIASPVSASRRWQKLIESPVRWAMSA